MQRNTKHSRPHAALSMADGDVFSAEYHDSDGPNPRLKSGNATYLLGIYVVLCRNENPNNRLPLGLEPVVNCDAKLSIWLLLSPRHTTTAEEPVHSMCR